MPKFAIDSCGKLLIMNQARWIVAAVLLQTLLAYGNPEDVPNEAISPHPPELSATDPQNSTVSTNPSLPPIITLAPASKVRYKLNLTHPGPSVLDSTLYFTAELSDEDGHKIPDTKKFSFTWMNMADLQAETTTGPYKTELPFIFPSADIVAGDYTMTVVATEEDNPSKILAFETKKFVLTENLNGGLYIAQDLAYQRLNNTFSTGVPVTASAVVWDVFRDGQTPVYVYFWYEGDKLIINSTEPQIDITVRSPKNFSMRSVVLGTVAVDSSVRDSRCRPRDKDCNESPDEATRSTDVKNGDFVQKLYFKDPLKSCDILRMDSEPDDLDVKIGSSVQLNVTCVGSAPTAVCFNITAYNSSLPANETCQPETFVDTLNHQVKLQITKSGWNDVHFYVYNDVSLQERVISYYAYDPNSANIPALVLPVVFGLLGLVVVLIGAAYIMRLRKKPLVEVADFHFHPSLDSSLDGPNPSRLSRVVLFIKHRMERQRRPRHSKSPAFDAGDDSLENSMTSLKTPHEMLLYDRI